SNYVLQRWPGGSGGPTLLQTAGAAHHVTADCDGRCDPILPGPARPSEGLQAVRAKANNARKPLTQEEREKTMEEVVETGLMKDGCSNFVFTALLSFLPVSLVMDSLTSSS
ncbi:hypothetical protein NQZ68_013084, partial [Dissostichus eleginoides]